MQFEQFKSSLAGAAPPAGIKPAGAGAVVAGQGRLAPRPSLLPGFA